MSLGEVILKFKTTWIRAFIVIAVVLLFVIIVIFYNTMNDKRLQDNVSSISHSPDYSAPLKLDRFPIYKQPNSWSCGPTTIRMVLAYLSEHRSNKQSMDESILTNRNSGMLPKTFEKYLRTFLKGYDVEFRNNIPDSELLKTIYGQLKKGLPVPIYFSTVNDWDKPNYDTHYSAVIGINFEKKEVTIANAYGYEEEVRLNDFLGSLKYSNYKNRPLSFQLATMAGIIKKNNIYIIEKEK